MFPDEIVTPRLRIRPFSREVVDPLDVYEYTGVSRSETVETEARYLGWIPHQTTKETIEIFDSSKTEREEANSAMYAIFPREGEDGAGELAGTAVFFPEWEKRRIGFGIWLRTKYWGRGYSGERAAAFFALCFDVLDLEVAVVYALTDNENSCRAIDEYISRFGGQADGTFRNEAVINDAPVDTRAWSVTRDQWKAMTDGEYDAEFYWNDRE